MGEIWHSLTREQQRMVGIVAAGVVLTLLVYFLTSGIIALAVAAIYAYSLGRYRATHRPDSGPQAAEPPPEDPATRVVASSRPGPQRRVRPAPQTPLGRLFAERPAWSGPPVGPFEPSQRTPPEEQDPYDSA